jgi:hypothetical protein
MTSTRCPLAGEGRPVYRTLADCPGCALAYMEAEAADAQAKLAESRRVTDAAFGDEVRRRIGVAADELDDVSQSVRRAADALSLSD